MKAYNGNIHVSNCSYRRHWMEVTGQLTFLSHAHYIGSWVGSRTAVDIWRRQTFVHSDMNQTLGHPANIHFKDKYMYKYN